MDATAPLHPTPAAGRRSPGAFTLGIGAWQLGEDVSAGEFAEQAAFAEALGFESFWLPENHFGTTHTLPAPLLLLAAAAAGTRRIRLGTGSYLLPIRHPVHMAEEVAVLDRVSGGRVILGVGRGYQSAMFAAFEVPAKERRVRFERALERMIAAWAGRPVAHDGGSDGGVPVYLSPRPVQIPHPPVWVAAFGPLALAQAGRLGLPYLASPIEPLELLVENFARHREATEAAGRPLSGEVPLMRTMFVSRDPARLARVRAGLAEQARTLARSGMPAIRRAAGDEVDGWAIVGEPQEVGERLARYRDALGMTHLIASRTRLPELSDAELRTSFELLAEVAADLGPAQAPA